MEMLQSVNPGEGSRLAPKFELILDGEDVGSFYDQSGIEDLRRRFVSADGRVPWDVLGKLRSEILARRDKVSRAMVSGGELSESEKEDTDVIPTALKVAEQVPEPFGGGVDIHSIIQNEVALDEKAEEAARALKKKRISVPTRSAISTPTIASHVDGGRSFLNKRGRDGGGEGLLDYNPSLAQEGTEDVYVGWVKGQLVDVDGAILRAGLDGTVCELVSHGEQVRVVSNRGVLLGKLAPSGARAMKRLRAAHPSVRVESLVTDGRQSHSARGGPPFGRTCSIEMLLYGPKGVVTEVQALFSGTGLEVQWGDDLDVKGPESVHRFSERERLRKEEEALREVMQDGDFDGSHEDELFEGGEDHDGMPEADAVSTVRTPLLLHQRKALHWMLLREQPSKPIFWEPYVSKRDNQRGWFNTVTRVFSRDPPDSPRGGLLADDMGLGKTLTVISLIMHGMRERRAAIGFGKVHASNMTGPTLVVSPLTVLQQWIDQFAKHTDGSARIYVYHGPGRTRHPLSLMLYDVVLTTYSTLGSEFVPEGKRALDDAASVLHCVPWSRVVLDEAHLIANRNALQSRAAVELPGETRWAITGTPVQNRLEDLFSIFAFLRIQPLDEFAVFQRLVLVPLRDRDPTALVRIRRILRVFSLRRTKEQRLCGRPIVMLPTKTIVLKQLRLSKREQAVYDALHARGRSVLGRLLAGGANSMLSQYTRILVLLLRLRQFCNHPCLVSTTLDASEPAALDGWLEGVEKQWNGGTAMAREDAGGVDSLLAGPQWTSRADLLAAVAECCEAIAVESETRAARDALRAGEVHLSDTGNECAAAITVQDALEVLHSTCTGIESDAARAIVDDALRWERHAKTPRIRLNSAEGGTGQHAMEQGAIASEDGPQEKNECVDDLPKHLVRVEALLELLRNMPELPGVPREDADGQHERNANNGEQVSSRSLSMGDVHFLSTKVEAVLHELDAIGTAGNGDKVVIFSQFVRFLDVLERAIASTGRKLVRIDGSVSREGRAAAIETFHDDLKTNVLLVTLKTGGMGLNLVAANHVLLTDLWWNGAAEDQAMDRVHRVGQQRKVRVVRFVTRRTVEERVLALQRKKQAMIKGAMSQKLTAADVEELFRHDA